MGKSYFRSVWHRYLSDCAKVFKKTFRLGNSYEKSWFNIMVAVSIMKQILSKHKILIGILCVILILFTLVAVYIFLKLSKLGYYDGTFAYEHQAGILVEGLTASEECICIYEWLGDVN